MPLLQKQPWKAAPSARVTRAPAAFLQMELDKATQRLTELQKEYKSGNPEKTGTGNKQPQEIPGSCSRTQVQHCPHRKRHRRHSQGTGPLGRLTPPLLPHQLRNPALSATGVFFYACLRPTGLHLSHCAIFVIPSRIFRLTNSLLRLAKPNNSRK